MVQNASTGGEHNQDPQQESEIESLRQEIRILQESQYVDKQKEADYQLQLARLGAYVQDTKERKKYASHIFYLVAGFLFFVLVIVWLSGVKDFYLINPYHGDKVSLIRNTPHFSFSFQLDNSVIITLLTTTCANVIAFLYVVVNYLFPQQNGMSRLPIPAAEGDAP